MPRRSDVALGFLVAIACGLALGQVASHPFVNWDDPQTLVNNDALARSGLLSWAFSTTHMSHYQPLSWLAWGALRRVFGVDARAYHLASLAGHALNAVLVFVLARVVGRAAGLEGSRLRVTAVAAALVFGLHPLRVEAVAWASALPYVLALGGLLVSTLLYLKEGRLDGLGSVAAYAVSLLCRPIGLGFPLVLLGLERARGRPWRQAALRALPFLLLAGAALVLEAQARPLVGFERVGLGPRLSAAASAPIVYLGREFFPFRLSPLDVSAITPRTSWLGLVGGALLVFAAVRATKAWPKHPWIVLGGAAYLLLLAPALGLAPSGLQETADRYTYVPDVALALLAGAAFSWAVGRWPRVLPLGITAAVALGGLAARQAGFWKDSVTLWTRAAQIDPRNDVAVYNLALALDEAGDHEGAERRLRETVELVPEHAPARRRLDALEARRLEQQAGAEAAAGRLAEAVALLGQALAKEPGRMRSHASRGMALAELGRCAEAVPDLKAALDLGNNEVEVASGLSFCLLQSGRLEEALAAGAAAAARHPDDPRVFGALAAIQEAAGRLVDAAASARKGAAVASRLGRTELSRALEAQARAYERESPGRRPPGAR